MNSLIEEYGQYLQRQDIDGARVFCYTEKLLRNTGIYPKHWNFFIGVNRSSSVIHRRGDPFYVMFHSTDEIRTEFLQLCPCISLWKKRTENRPEERIAQAILNDKGESLIKELINRNREDYILKSSEEFAVLADSGFYRL